MEKYIGTKIIEAEAMEKDSKDGYKVIYVPTTAELVLEKIAIIEGRWKAHYEKQAMSKL